MGVAGWAGWAIAAGIAVAVGLMFHQRLGLQALVRRSGMLKLAPKRLAAMEALLPVVPSGFAARMRTRTAATAPQRRRVGMLTGCVQQVFFAHVNATTARVLAAPPWCGSASR